MAAPCFPKTSEYRKLGDTAGEGAPAQDDYQQRLFESEVSFLADIRRNILRPANLLLAELIGESWNWMELD
jgi:hypothetical protein